MTKTRWAVILTVMLLLISAFAADVSVFARDCEELRGDVLRLHVIANSDSEEDQAVKLRVRDLLLDITKDRVGDAVDKADAERFFAENAAELTEAVNAFLRESGLNYGAALSLARSEFETREYDGFTLPSGEYDALKVVLGAGEGKNWWCVLFPPLCVSAADGSELPAREYKLMQSGGTVRYKIKLKIVEWFRYLKSLFE
ncbi:MAG: stage II sporulation protein R [Clostridia bacterium]|nr:stage II sporulation protein R [Clostridia bacterium]